MYPTNEKIVKQSSEFQPIVVRPFDISIHS